MKTRAISTGDRSLIGTPSVVEDRAPISGQQEEQKEQGVSRPGAASSGGEGLSSAATRAHRRQPARP